jgi:hypothetical protein
MGKTRALLCSRVLKSGIFSGNSRMDFRALNTTRVVMFLARKKTWHFPGNSNTNPQQITLRALSASLTTLLEWTWQKVRSLESGNCPNNERRAPCKFIELWERFCWESAETLIKDFICASQIEHLWIVASRGIVKTSLNFDSQFN